MKAKNLREEYAKLHERAKQQLIKALSEHDGRYVWYDVDDELEVPYEIVESYEYGDLELPEVMVFPDDDCIPLQMAVCELELVKGTVYLQGFKRDSDDLDVIVYTLDEIDGENAYRLMEMMRCDMWNRAIEEGGEDGPLTKEFPVLSVSRRELVERGYDALKLSDEEMRQLAENIGQYFMENGFGTVLDALASHNLPEITEP